MRLTYDEDAGASYLHLRHDGEDVGTVSSMPITPPGGARADDRIVLDFDDDGRFVGIEFMTPQERLLPSVLDSRRNPSSLAVAVPFRSADRCGPARRTPREMSVGRFLRVQSDT
jgi:uncharacterized protein YuzE